MWPNFSGLCAIALIALTPALQGCTGSANSFGDGSTKQMQSGAFTQLNSAAPSKSDTAASLDDIYSKTETGIENPEDYKIGALDTLDVAVLGVADLTKTVQVNSGGNITLPLIRQVRAVGRTQMQLEADIARKLSATYLQNPQVTVSVKEFNSQRITVDGAVTKPGIFPKLGPMTLLQAIAQAQGLTNFADPTGVLVFRMVEGKRMGARFDIRQVRSGKQSDPQLIAGDVVMVDENSTKTAIRDVSQAMPLTGLFSLLKFF